MSAEDLPESSLDVTPEQALAEAAETIKRRRPDKLLVIMLCDEEPGEYRTAFINSGLSCTQAITLLEVIKDQFMEEIRDYNDRNGRAD